MPTLWLDTILRQTASHDFRLGIIFGSNRKFAAQRSVNVCFRRLLHNLPDSGIGNSWIPRLS